jgi:two-component system, cell cycle sensor histidine kinase and response regulator CckA
MQLKGKILFVLITVILSITLAYFLVFRMVILQSFIDLEKLDAEDDMQRCVATLDREMRLLGRFAYDWANWDDTYAFVQDGNQEYIKSNLTPDVFKNQKLSLIHFYNLQGRLVAGKAFDQKTGSEFSLDLGRELNQKVLASLVNQRKIGSSTMGIIQTSHGPMMVASWPVLTSAATGPIKGTIMMGRLISDEVIRQISEQVEVKLSIVKTGEKAHPGADAHPADAFRNRIILRVEGNDNISAYATIRDLGNNPVFTLHADMPRSIMKKGMRAYWSGYLFIIGGGILILIFVGGLIQFLVLDPVSRLNRSIIAVAAGAAGVDKGLTARKDELGTLSNAFDNLLQNLRDREQTLWLGEQRLRQIIDAVPHLIYAKDENGRYILANKAIADLLGCSVQEIIGKSDAELMKAPAEAHHYRSMDIAVLGSGEQKIDPGEVITDAKGKVHILQTEKMPFTFSGTTERAVLGVSVDITEIKKAEDALKDSEQRMSDIISFLPDATFAIDMQGRVIVWNRAMEELTGVAREDIVGKGDHIYAIPFYGKRRPMLLDLILEPRGDMYKQYDFIHKVGETLIVEVFVQRLFEGRGGYMWAVSSKLFDSAGNVAGAIESIRDITLRKKDEELLMHQRAIIEQSLDGIVMADLDGSIMFANHSAGEMFGLSPAQLEGQNMRSFHTEEQYRAEMAPLMEEMNTMGRSTGKVGHMRKDGSTFTALETLFLLKDHKGDAVAIIAIIRDISEEIKMEGQLRQAQKMEVIGQLAGGVAHDLNNLLAPILGYTEMILQVLPEDDPSYHGLFQVITAADRARKLTRQLLAFGSKQVLEVKTVDLSEVVESYDKMIRRTIREDIQIRITKAQSLPGVLVDPAQMGQILMNLALNAQDAMPAGGVITIDTAAADIDEAYTAAHQGIAPGTYVRLTVSDTGMGMDRETLEHIFEPFFTTKDRGKGTGLGLATVYGIVTQHKGHVLVYSEPGTGTTFKIYLPMAEGSVEKLSDKVDIGAGKRGRETVVVAEDDEGVRLLTCEILEKHGYRVVSAQELEEFIRLIDSVQGAIDLMITDVIMPNMNGKQLFERVRAGHPEMKVLFMSGYTDDVIAHHGILEQGVNFIQKPYSIQGLTDKVRQVLDN